MVIEQIDYTQELYPPGFLSLGGGYLKPANLYFVANNKQTRALSLIIKHVDSDNLRRERERTTQLDLICQLLKYNPNIQRFAWFYYSKIRRSERVPHSNKLLAAAIYAAARETIGCVSIRDIVAAFKSLGFKIALGDVAKMYSCWKKYLPRLKSKPELYLFKILACLSESEHVKLAVSKAGLELNEMLVDVFRRSRSILRSHASIASRESIKCAAAIFLAFKQCKVQIGACVFAKAIHASEGNLRSVTTALANKS